MADPKHQTGYLTPEGEVCTPVGILKWGNLFKAILGPKKTDPKDAKFGCTLLLPLDADLTLMKQLAQEAAVKKFGADEAKWPKTLRSPFRDQSEKDFSGFVPGAKYINVSSKYKPGCVDAAGNEIIEEAKLWDGCKVRLIVNAYAYSDAGNCGVSFGLQAVQKIADGELLLDRARAEKSFEAVAPEKSGAGTVAGIFA